MTVFNLPIQDKQDLTKLTPSSSTQNLAEITLTPQKSALLEDEVDEEIRWKCSWRKCTAQFKHIDEVYDHVVSVHIQSKSKDETITEETEICCEWETCKMELCRGDTKKKIDWLEQHYRTRHAPYARPYKCVIEGCLGRASTSRQLEEHVRIKHIMAKPKRVRKEVIKPVFRWLPTPYIPPIRGTSWTNLTINDMRNLAAKNCFVEENGGKVKYEVVKEHNLVGSAKRKTGYTHSWRPKLNLVKINENDEKKDQKPESDAKFDVETESALKLEDIFPNLRNHQATSGKGPMKLFERESMSPCPILRPETYHNERCVSPSGSDPSAPSIKCEKPPNRKSVSPRKSPSKRKSPRKQKKEEAEIHEEMQSPSKKRARQSLPYGVFEEDSTDNEDAFGFERIPDEILKSEPKKKRFRLDEQEGTSSSSSSSSTCKYNESAVMEYAKIHERIANINIMDAIKTTV